MEEGVESSSYFYFAKLLSKGFSSLNIQSLVLLIFSRVALDSNLLLLYNFTSETFIFGELHLFFIFWDNFVILFGISIF